MKRIERFRLIDKIGRELQSKMTLSDINVYLSGFKIEIDQGVQSVSSKWVYVKDTLSNVPDETISKIAKELEIQHDFYPSELDLGGSKFWLSNHFRLFISHLSAYKVKASQLQKALNKYYITSFVAHEDIEPTKEWQEEILKALFSMDSLVAIITEKFNNSKWTDQEVGIALGRDVMVIPIRKNADPYGFIAKYQGLNANGKTVADVAKEVFEIIGNHPKSKNRMSEVLVNQIILSRNDVEAVSDNV